MEFLKRHWTQIRVYLEGLTLAEKWLVVALLAVMLLAGSWFAYWVAQPSRVPIHAFAGAQNQEVMSRLRNSGVDATQEGGQILVPVGDRDSALSVLAQHDLLSADTSEAFTQLIENQSPWQTDRQNRQAYLLAMQRVLGQIIGNMGTVQRAEVIVSMPQDQGFGRTHVRPSGSVTVWMRGGERVDDGVVDSVARLVAGSVAEMRPQDVSVTDGNFGRTRTVRDSDDMLPTDTLELVGKLEERYQRRIDNLLGYIRGATVAVNVQVDPVARKVEEAFDYEENEPLESEEFEEMVQEDLMDGGEPGARPNTGLDIDGGSGGSSTETMLREQTRYREKPLVLRSQSQHAGHQVEHVNVSINVPRRFFSDIYRRNNPDLEGEPTDADLQEIVDAQLAQIESQVEPLTRALAEGEVRVHMVPDDSYAPEEMGTATAGGVTGLLASGWATTAGVGLLALVSLALMLMMVRKATQQEELPSVEELAGMPPTVGDDDFVTEAEEGDLPMSGVEVNEDVVRSRRMADQLSELIKSNPDEAGTLLGRWLRQGA